jgi:ATP-dependent helicase YprA (DUF1998 family)
MTKNKPKLNKESVKKEQIIKTENGWELIFYNFITHRIGRIIIKNGFKCKKCKKLVKGNFSKIDHSFDIYHPKCMNNLPIKMKKGVEKII